MRKVLSQRLKMIVIVNALLNGNCLLQPNTFNPRLHRQLHIKPWAHDQYSNLLTSLFLYGQVLALAFKAHMPPLGQVPRPLGTCNHITLQYIIVLFKIYNWISHDWVPRIPLTLHPPLWISWCCPVWCHDGQSVALSSVSYRQLNATEQEPKSAPKSAVDSFYTT